MPYYEYQCDACGEIVVELQRMSDAPLEDCPPGDGGALTKLLSAHNVGGVASGAEAARCAQAVQPSCGSCDMAGTGCS